ncbi:hypothetical protein BDA96_04G082000 [Sorghum bicolor]|uniref:Knottins-like domain-containing protein n=1 Tax=Sorghum bicolor TaxID=4558 RepID=A0A921R2S8_SORBI|nr:hypothetical protein BDA96_04G082000 [Sorghum bicolor]
MAPSKKNLSAIMLLIVIVAAVCSMPACTQSCPNLPLCGHLSGNYHGPCIGDDGCSDVCKDESFDNFCGACDWFKCYCYTACSSEIVAVASAPIQP